MGYCKKLKLCSNCLTFKSHTIDKCRAKLCKICTKPHNTILCSKDSNDSKSDSQTENELPSISSNNAIVPATQAVLLPTAIVYVKDINGISQNCRLLIDSASQGSFIRESCVNSLQLNRTKANISVDGLSSRKVGRVAGSVKLQTTSQFNKNASITVDALITPKITCDLPQCPVDASVLKTFKQLQLADVNCHQPGPIDIRLGADVFGEIMLSGHLNVSGISASESIFGWVILGKTKGISQTITSNHASCNAVEFELDKFWQLKEISNIKPYTQEETACENHFIQTFSRDSTGRFAVKFPFRKSSNELTNLIQEDLRLPNASLSIDDDTANTLGILWHPASDVFSFKVNSLFLELTLTKNTLLSTIAKTFDPLGWLSPITIQSKLLTQKLWKYQLQCGMKSFLQALQTNGRHYQRTYYLSKISKYLFHDPDKEIPPDGFSDASEKAYAAVIYCHSVSNTGQIKVQLVIAKTKVAPLKTISLPRLELCGALLLSKLMDFTCKAFDIPISQSHFHTDSTIVLAWIGSHASRWKTFVANRVAKIQTLSSPTQWHHVSGNENPADLATRGVSSSALLTSVWLCGPEFLYNECSFHPESSVPTLNDSVSTLNDPVPEERCCVQSTIAANHLPNSNDLFQKYSSLSKLKRAAAYCLRFVNNCRNSKDKVTGFLNTSELTNAINVLIKSVQFIVFNNEINALKINQALSCRSKILSLNPFLDNSGILRVGGRLRHANIAYGHKHPILLPKGHILTDLIVRHYHEILLHACPQLVQSSIQEQYWIIGYNNQEAVADFGLMKEYQTVLDKELSKNVLDDDDVNRKWESTKRSILSTTEKILKRERAPIIQDWFDNECRAATENKNKAYKKMINRKFTRNATEEYKQTRSNEKRLHKSKKKCHKENLLEEVERLKSSNESRAFYRAVNKEHKDFKPKTTLCKDKNRGIISEKEKVIERWVEHFNQLLKTGTQTPSQVIIEAPAEEYEEEDLIETPTIDEVQDIIDKLKNHKAAGPDEIPSELIKYGGKKLTRIIYEIIILIWESETVPKEWNLGILCPVHKKGDALNCENYRGISLLCIAY
ncbi:DUF1758 domain-containing protein [Caerostris darwini]|uniref:DUF1758 domain-containing protein n=1 Tax=Caerostris darwini TaxID=1538125 RepID=A0AAV4QAN2_9ARAC|nr:DUF1758 domain-containing protein [Caerostris darwini]